MSKKRGFGPTMTMLTVLNMLSGCASAGAEGPCEALNEHLSTCGAILDEASHSCDPDEVDAVLAMDCDQIGTVASAGKADGTWDRLLCTLGFESRCPLGAPVRDPATGRLDRYDLPGATLHPEAGAFSVRQNAFFVGSLDDGGVLRVDAASGEVSTLLAPQHEDWSSLGMAVQEDINRLWVCAIRDVDAQYGEVWSIDMNTGARARYDLRDAHEHGSCNDLALGPDGTVYVTDRENPNVYVLRPGAETVELLVSDPVLAPPRLGLGQNGIVVLPEEAGLITTQYLPPRLNFVSFSSETPTVERIEVDGDFHDYSSLGSGADGMVLLGGSLFVMFATELVEVALAPDYRSGTAHAIGVRGGMTDVVPVEDELYLLNGQAVAFVAGADPAGTFALFRFDASR
ncbi:MAG: SMP-30/gluconolactonase/LRE family protein [Sandaracinaceae bacterium]